MNSGLALIKPQLLTTNHKLLPTTCDTSRIKKNKLVSSLLIIHIWKGISWRGFWESSSFSVCGLTVHCWACGAVVTWVIDACCLLCLCFTGSCSHYSDTTGLLPILIPDLSSWFPVGGSCPTSPLHHPCLCLQERWVEDGDFLSIPICRDLSPSRTLSFKHDFACFFCGTFFLWTICYRVWREIIYCSCVNISHFVKMLNAFSKW